MSPMVLNPAASIVRATPNAIHHLRDGNRSSGAEMASSICAGSNGPCVMTGSFE
jgi:hypothetical protein